MCACVCVCLVSYVLYVICSMYLLFVPRGERTRSQFSTSNADDDDENENIHAITIAYCNTLCIHMKCRVSARQGIPIIESRSKNVNESFLLCCLYFFLSFSSAVRCESLRYSQRSIHGAQIARH